MKTRRPSVPALFIASALALGLGAAAQAQTTTAPEPASTTSKAVKNTERAVSDSWITTKVKSEIFANSVSKGFKVKVKTKQGNVMLSGKLPNQEGIDLVKSIAEKVKGVKGVDTSGLSVGT